MPDWDSGVEILLLTVDRAVVLGSALVVALFALGISRTPRVAHALPADESTAAGIQPKSAEEILNQVQFPPPDPLGSLPEIDTLGNILLSVEADAVVTHDGGPDGPTVAGMDIRGSRCSRSVYSVMVRSPSGPWTVICLPREYGLYERMNGRPAPGYDAEGPP